MVDRPLGGNKMELDEFAKEDNKPVEMPDSVEEKLASKKWDVRAAGFEQVSGLFRQAKSQSDDCFFEHGSQLKKYLQESNPAALEKALIATESFIDCAEPKGVMSFQGDIIKALIEKCIGHMKPTVKQKGLECFNMLFEVTEGFEEGEEPIIEAMKNKNVKVISSAFVAVNSLLANFGSDKVKIKSYIGQAEEKAGNTNPAVKSEALNFYKEAFRWLQDALLPMVQKLKKQQQDDLEKVFQDTRGKDAIPLKQTRKEKKAARNKEIDQLAAAEKRKEDAEKAALEMCEEVDILTEYNYEWCEAIQALKNWKEKKDKLDVLQQKSDTMKLAKGDYTELVNTLKKLCNDNNQMVCNVAIKTTGQLAKALRKQFEQYGKEVAASIIPRFKERKLIEETHNTLDNLMNYCFNLEQIVFEVKAGLGDKAPSTKKNSAIFLEKAIQKTYIDVLEGILEEVVPQLLKNADESNGEVRDSALNCLGILKGRCPDKMESFLSALTNPQKVEKITQVAGEVKPSKYDKPEKQPEKPKRKVGGPPARLAGGAKKGTKVKKEVPEEEKQEIDEAPIQGAVNPDEDRPIGGGAKKDPFADAYPPGMSEADVVGASGGGGGFDEQPIGGGGAKKDPMEGAYPDGVDPMEIEDNFVASKPPPKKPIARPKKQPEEEEKKPQEERKFGEKPAHLQKKNPTGPVKGPSGPKIEQEAIGGGIPKELAIEKVEEVYPPETLKRMEEAKWQEKVACLEEMTNFIAENQPGDDVIEATVKWLKAKLKDWKDSNMNMNKAAINMIKETSKSSSNYNKRAAHTVMPLLCEKIGDIKFKENCGEAILNLCEQVGPKFIMFELMLLTNNHKVAKVYVENCNLVAKAVAEFSIIGMPLKELIEYFLCAVSHTDQKVRTASLEIVRNLYLHAGDVIKAFIKDIKDLTQKTIDDELAKITPLPQSEVKSNRPLRGLAASAKAPGAGGKPGAASAAGGGASAAAALDEALGPRENISKAIAKILPVLNEKDPKQRIKGAEQIEAAFKKANYRILPDGLNDLVAALVQKLADSNKAVAKAYIANVGQLAEALGPGFIKCQKKICLALLPNLADKQSLVRDAVQVQMQKIVNVTSPETVMNYLIPLLKTDNPQLRTEGLNFTLKYKENIQKAEISTFVKPLVQGLQDKNPQIRGMMEEVVGEIMIHTGYSDWQDAVKDMKPALQATLKGMLEKIKNKVGAGATGGNANASKDADMSTAKQSTADSTTSSFAKPPKQEPKEERKPLQKKMTTTEKGPRQRSGSAQKQKPEEIKPASKLGMGMKRPTTAAPAAASKKAADQSEPFVIQVGNKQKRADYDKRSPWIITEKIRDDQLERLKNDIRASFGEEMSKKMWGTDFNKHCQCLDQLQEAMVNQPDEFEDSLDLIFKWAQAAMLSSSNMKFIVNFLDFAQKVVDFEFDRQYMFQEFEILVLYPLLTDKAGHNNQTIQQKGKNVVISTFPIVDKAKAHSLLITALNTKNNKVKSETLEIICVFLQEFQAEYTSTKDAKLIAKQADNPDKGVRESSLKVLSELYKIMGEDIWKTIGDVPTKVQGLLEQRFKKIKMASGGGNMGSSIGGGSKLGSSMSMATLQQQQQKSSQQRNTEITNSGKKQTTTTTTPRGGTLKFGGQAAASTQNNPLGVKQTQSQGLKKALPQTQRVAGGNLQKVSSFALNQEEDNAAQAVQQKKPPKFSPPPQNQPNTLVQQKQMQNWMNSDDQDDEAIREILQAQAGEEDNLLLDQEDPLQDEEEEEADPNTQALLSNISQLKFGDLSRRVDALVNINELISNVEENAHILQNNADELTAAFNHVMKEIFDKSLSEIPLRFAKYFLTIIHKVSTMKEIMQHISRQKVFEFTEQLLTRLLIDGLDKVGDQGEGGIIIKNLNSSMLRLLENCDHTYIFCVLFDLLNKYRNAPQLPKLPGLIIKCLLKLSKIIEKIINDLKMEEILLSIHLYLINIDHDNKTSNDEMGVRIVKTVTNEIVKLKKEAIWEPYRVIQAHSTPDQHIQRWIQIIIKSLNNGPDTTSSGQLSVDQEMLQIMGTLNQPANFDDGIKQLVRMLKANPQINLDDYLRSSTKTFQNFVKSTVEKELGNEGLSAPQIMQNTSEKAPASSGFQEEMKKSASSAQQPPRGTMTPSSSKITDYQNKLNSIKQRFGKDTTSTNEKPKTGSTTTKNQVDKMNTSFSAMNNSISKKWNEISKKKNEERKIGGGIGGGISGTTPALSNTIGGGVRPAFQGNGGQLNQSSGAGSIGGGSQSGATNTDLNQRLAEMKQKLQALKKK